MPDTVFVSTWSFGEAAVRTCWAWWLAEHDLERAAVAGTAAIEIDPTIPTVGRGGLPNRAGVMELDAAFMRGSDLRCGAVAALRKTLPAIDVAYKVATRTDHILLAGQGADDFAIANGFTPQSLLTDATRQAYDDWKAKAESGTVNPDRMVGHDTVGVLGWHRDSHAAQGTPGESVACVATSGLGYKRPGRVGDSPIVGAGLYADDHAGAVVCTGVGEEIFRHALAIRITDAMARGQDAHAACHEVFAAMLKRDPRTARQGISALAIRSDGQIGAATTRTENHSFEYHLCADGHFDKVVPEPMGAD
ncbi:MAG: isoaspartyl peptidase/L-asparaginase [Phycisphaerales bacterium JB063]